MHRSRLTPWTFLFACLVASAGCFEDVGDDIGSTAGTSGDGDGDPSGDGDGDPSGDGDGDPSGDGDGDPSGDGDGDPTGGDQCDSDFMCAPDLGDDWTGPFALRPADVGCGGLYPDEIESLFADLEVGASSCDCNCGSPTVSCSNNMLAIGYSQNNCVDGQGGHPLSPQQCYNTFSASHAVSLSNASSTCGNGNVTAQLPTPSFAVEAVSCGGFEPGPGACEGTGLCVPKPAAGPLCYSTAGNVECPAEYPERTTYFDGVEDTRSCPNTCSCTGAGATCQVTITRYASDNCSSSQGTVSTDSGTQVCAAATPAIHSIRPGNVTIKNSGSCQPGNAALTGDVAATGATTVCCSQL